MYKAPCYILERQRLGKQSWSLWIHKLWQFAITSGWNFPSNTNPHLYSLSKFSLAFSIMPFLTKSPYLLSLAMLLHLILLHDLNLFPAVSFVWMTSCINFTFNKYRDSVFYFVLNDWYHRQHTVYCVSSKVPNSVWWETTSDAEN